MTDSVASLPPVSQMMRDAGLEPKKQFGQNFLFDLNLTGRIARAVPDIDKIPVIEVGPGPGGLTRAILAAGAPRVIAIEKDRAAAPILSRIADSASGRLQIVYGDALKTDFAALGVGEYAICANLPYNVGTELLIGWLHMIWSGAPIRSLTLMFQREVAQRIVARGGGAYGRLSILTSLIADARILFEVPPTAFVPRPKVYSAVVQIIPGIVFQQPSVMGSSAGVTVIPGHFFLSIVIFALFGVPAYNHSPGFVKCIICSADTCEGILSH